MAKKNINSMIENIIAAALQSDNCLKSHLNRDMGTQKNDHSYVDAFQMSICKALNSLENSEYKWEIEKTNDNNDFLDPVDILGEGEGQTKWIIEIDASRHDQVAAKFLSRLAAWGKTEPINYVALLYKNTQNGGKSACEKFIYYATSIAKIVNERSNVYGIFVNVDKDGKKTSIAELWEYQEDGQQMNCSFSVSYKKGEETELTESMIQCGQAAIRKYINYHDNIDFNALKDVFGRYVNNNVGGSRYIKLENVSFGVYTYSQFRATGKYPCWFDFVDLCKDHNISIENVWPRYVIENAKGETDSQINMLEKIKVNDNVCSNCSTNKKCNKRK